VHIDLTPDQRAFRDEMRTYFEKLMTPELVAEVAESEGGGPLFRAAMKQMGKDGLLGIGWPKEYGGQARSSIEQYLFSDEAQRSGFPLPFLTLNTVGPTLMQFGTEEQRKFFLPQILAGEIFFCIGYSEPSAGTDLGSLQTRAVRDGDDWVLNGQKVWTTVAHLSRWGMLLARTNPDVPKHDGLSYFLMDMHAPGVEVRPLYQITGEAEFNEVFMNDVRIPHERMLGKEGQGWRVAITTLMNERVAIGTGVAKRRGGGAISQLVKLWGDRPQGALSTGQEALLRDRVTQCWIEAELQRVTAQRARAAQKAGNPGPEGSVSKLAGAEINKHLWETAIDVLGPTGLSFEAGYELRQGFSGTGTPEALAKYQFLRSRANSIEGGTSEIMRNILGERVLGLPGEPRVDKEVPWKDVPRS